jgi:regulator of sigma D
MTNGQTDKVVDRRTGTRTMIDKLLAERKEMLTLYWHVAGLEPLTPEKPIKEHLQEFCEVLVDYIAFGHFEVYDRIGSGKERRGAVVSIAEQIYPNILDTTDVAVAFNDKYDENDHELHLENLSKDLSQMGEVIATRIELEDRLIEVMLQS